MSARRTSEDPSGALDRARAYGVDVSLLTAALRLTPAQRLERLDEAATALAELRAATLFARRREGV